MLSALNIIIFPDAILPFLLMLMIIGKPVFILVSC